MLEVNPRASRTVPFVAKATGMPVARVATKVMAGVSLAEQGYHADPIPAFVSVKESVFPFSKFAGVDIVLGPEMRSTGEVMGVSERFSIAFAKSQLAAGILLPKEGRIFLSVASPAAKEHMVGLAARLAAMGFQLMATEGTARVIEATGIPVEHVKKLQEGHPNLLDHLIDGRVQLDHEHAARQGGPDRRRADSRGVGDAWRAVHHDDSGGRRLREGDGGAARRRDDRAGAAGSLSARRAAARSRHIGAALNQSCATQLPVVCHWPAQSASGSGKLTSHFTNTSAGTRYARGRARSSRSDHSRPALADWLASATRPNHSDSSFSRSRALIRAADRRIPSGNSKFSWKSGEKPTLTGFGDCHILPPRHA